MVHHIPSLVFPTITLSHLTPFLGEQSHRRALQFLILANPTMSLNLICFVGSISGTSWNPTFKLHHPVCRGTGQCHDKEFSDLEYALQFRYCHPESSGQGGKLVYEG